MAKFFLSFKKLKYFNLQVDLTSGDYGTFLLKQTDPSATGHDRYWEYVDNDIKIYCAHLRNTVDSWIIIYNESSNLKYYIEFRGDDPWNIIEGSFKYVIGKSFDPVITKVDPNAPVVKYYNVLVDFEGTSAADFGIDNITLNLSDPSKTGMDRRWANVIYTTNENGFEVTNVVIIQSSSTDKSVWDLSYTWILSAERTFKALDMYY